MNHYHHILHHYEIEANLEEKRVNSLKEEAFNIMNTLHGWCSHQKAEILIDLICMIKPSLIIEIGVFGGKSLIPMALALKKLRKGKIIGIDPWDKKESIRGMMNHLNREWWEKVDHELIYQEFLNNIIQFKLSRYVTIVRETSANACTMKEIDILHLDGSHSSSATLLDVEKWVPCVRKNGLIVMEDVNWPSSLKAVEYLNKTCIKLIEISEENVWAIWVK